MQTIPEVSDLTSQRIESDLSDVSKLIEVKKKEIEMEKLEEENKENFQ